MRLALPEPSVFRAAILGLAAAGAFCLAFVAGASGRSLDDYLEGWRGWDDLAIASVYVRDGAFPIGPYVIGNLHRRTSPEFRAFRRPIMKAFKDRPVSEFWVSVDTAELVNNRAFPVTRVDDSGRAFFLSLAFRISGAVRPLLLLWLPVLLVAIALGWATCELSSSGRSLAAILLALFVSASAFFREGAAVTYAAYGAYFATAIALVAFATAMTRKLTPRGRYLRLLGASAILMVAVPSRSAALLMAPAFFLSFALAQPRPARLTGRVASALAGLALLIGAPMLAVRAIDRYSAISLQAASRDAWPSASSTGHDTWPTLWIGLGDFDRTKGHRYLDEAAKEVALAAGFDDRIAPGAEAHFRSIILGEIVSDPGWFLEIVARRVEAAFTLRKLWPTAAASGSTFAPSSHRNEGAFDSYMALLPTADRFGWGRWAFEAPAWIYVLAWPALGIVLLGRRANGPHQALFRILVPALIGLMASPVIVTTASAIEMQAMALAHALAWALAIDEAARGLRGLPERKQTDILRPS